MSSRMAYEANAAAWFGRAIADGARAGSLPASTEVVEAAGDVVGAAGDLMVYMLEEHPEIEDVGGFDVVQYRRLYECLYDLSSIQRHARSSAL